MKHFLDRYRPLWDAEGAGSGGAQAPSSPASAPTTSPEPGAAPPSGGEEAAPDLSNDFMQLGADDDVVVLPAETPPAAATPAPAQPAPEGKPAAQPAQAQPPAQTPPAQTPPAAQNQPPAVASEAPQPPADDTPRGLVEQLAQHRDAMIEAIAGQRFALSKEDAEAFAADPAGVAPKLAARVYYEATQAALLHIQNYVPRMVQQMMRDMKEHDEAENAFYGKFKALDKTKHAQDVLAFSKAFRATNPKIGRDDLWAMIAAAVVGKYGLSAPQVQNGANGAAPQHQPSQVPAFVPAQSGAGGVRVTTSNEESPFAGLGRDYDD